MLGSVAAMRRTLLSCTALARRGAMALVTLCAVSTSTFAADLSLSQTISALLDLNQQEFAALTTALSLLGFTVLAAILLMRTRIRASKVELGLRSDIADLQVQADRLRALLFAEPQILIAWAAGDNRPQISGDTSLLISPDALSTSPQRILAFGTWLAPEPARQMDHAVDALLEAGEGFLLNLATLNGRAIEAMGRAIGGQAIVRIRELGGLRRDLAEANLRYRALVEETELLRDFAAAAPWPIWAKSIEGNLRYANTAYVRATEGASVAETLDRGLELLENDQRAEMNRALNDNSSFSARLPIVVGGERRIYDVEAFRLSGGTAGIAIDASEAAQLRDAMERMAEAHRRTIDQLSSGVAVFDGQRRLAFYNESYRRLWGLDQAFLDSNPDDSSVLDRLRAARKLPEQPDFRAWKAKLHEAYSAVDSENYTWFLPDGRALSVVTTPSLEGGVTYLFDNVTESLDLARRFDRLTRVQH
jgi:PAS domain-containing protein